MTHRLIALLLILTNAFVVLSKGNEVAHTMANPDSVSFSRPPSPGIDEGHEEGTTTAEAPAIRKLGEYHCHHAVKPILAPSLSPSEAPQVSGLDQVAENLQTNTLHHHSLDKSVAGGGVILGGLATTFLVAVFCYIRATGRKNAEPDNNA
ncbi:hypothetical protein NMG60_11000295 [Bertholletia excelsa]